MHQRRRQDLAVLRLARRAEWIAEIRFDLALRAPAPKIELTRSIDRRPTNSPGLAGSMPDEPDDQRASATLAAEVMTNRREPNGEVIRIPSMPSADRLQCH